MSWRPTYEKGMFNQLQDVMSAFEKLSSDFEEFKIANKWEIAVLKESHRQEIAELKAAHQEEISGLEAKITSLEAENALLKARINKDSNNIAISTGIIRIA